MRVKTSNPDVLVAGAGPAGLAAAITLQRYTSATVCVLGGSAGGAVRPGETVSRGTVPLLDYLGVAAILSESCAIEGYGTEAAWGSAHVVSRDSIFTGRGEGLHLDRSRFDDKLATEFERRGGRIIHDACVRHAERIGGSWSVSYTASGQSARVLASQVIDATGRRAAFTRRIGIGMRRLDALVGVTMYLDQSSTEPIPHRVLIEAVPDGWWYSAPLPGRRAVVAFMTDADLLARLRLDSPEAMTRRMRSAPATWERLRSCTNGSAPRTHQAGTQTPARVIGEGWLAAGDAAMALDPLSSIGIGHALASGIHAARVTHARLATDEELAHAYGADVSRHLEHATDQWRAIYGSERRWPDAPFWHRRHVR